MSVQHLSEKEVHALRKMLREGGHCNDTPITNTFCGLTAREVVDLKKENSQLRAQLQIAISTLGYFAAHKSIYSDNVVGFSEATLTSIAKLDEVPEI